MTVTPQVRPGTPVLSAADAVEVAQMLAAEYATDATARDRERRLPYAEVERLKASGLLSIAVPARHGGPDLPPSTVSAVFATLAAGDPNIAQAVHSHFVYCNLVRISADPDQQVAVFDKVLAGRLIANAQAERHGPTANDIATTLTARSDGYLVLTGTKYYCTGSPFADMVAVLAELDDATAATGLPEGQVVVFLPAGTQGLTVVDDWDALGQRTTGSGTVRLDGIEVRRRWVVPRTAPGTTNGYGAYAQLLHASIDVGIARGALRDAAEFVRARSRPWFEAGVARAEDDPLTVQRFGELEVEVITAEAVLERAQRSVDAVVAAPGEERATRASLDVAAAKVVSERAAVGVSSALFEVCGTRAASPDVGLDRHWRNARTHTLHDPVRWKYQHLGRHALTGQAPPRHAAI